MKYVALLRGINVGGRNKVVMSELKSGLVVAGLQSVVTYINSGNILFSSHLKRTELVTLVEDVIKDTFELDIKVLLRSEVDISKTVHAMNTDWHTDKEHRYDVMFLWEDIDNIGSIDLLSVTPGIDNVEYIPGAIVWHVSKSDYSKSGMNKLIGTRLYKSMTARNSNTVRKVHGLFNEVNN